MRPITNETCDRRGPSTAAKVLVRNIPMISRNIETGDLGFGRHGELTFCGHCATFYALTFLANNYMVHDYRLFGERAA